MIIKSQQLKVAPMAKISRKLEESHSNNAPKSAIILEASAKELSTLSKTKIQKSKQLNPSRREIVCQTMLIKLTNPAKLSISK
jgi:hypothetical protein